MTHSNTRSPYATDAELVERMLDNDGQAWRWFTTRYRPLIMFAMRGLLLQFAAHAIDPEDVYAAVLSSLVVNDMHKLRAFDRTRGTKLSGWVALLTRHATWDFLREARRLCRVHEALAWQLPASDELDPFEQLASRESITRLDEARAELTARDQRFFELSYLDCAQPAAIAAELGISIKTVYTKAHKVRGKLLLSVES